MEGCVKCSLLATQAERDECVGKLSPDWNGLCAYQSDGCSVEDWDKDSYPNCRGCEVGGCVMSGHQYARWNGLCAYQKHC